MRLFSFSRPVSPARNAATACAVRGASAALPDEWGGVMTATQGGHGSAYHRLLAEISEWLNRHFARGLPVGEVDDAVQETSLAVHWRRPTFDPAYRLGPWLAALAKRKWVDRPRGIGRRALAKLPDDLLVDDDEAAVTSASALERLLEELRLARAHAFLLFKVQGYSIEEGFARDRTIGVGREDEHPPRARPPARYRRGIHDLD